MRGWVTHALRIVALLVAAGPVLALDTVTWLYQVDVDVADQSPKAREEAAAQGLVEVLSRVSGLAEPSVSEPALASALAQAERYVSRYTYQSELDEGQRRTFVQFNFEPTLVQDLARNAGLPIWSSRRPTIATWVGAVASRDFELLVDGEAPMLEALAEAGRKRGIALTVPEDAPPTRLLYQGASEPVLRYAQSAGTHGVLVGRVETVGGRGYAGRFELMLPDRPGEVFNLNARSEQQLAAQAANRVADVLARQFSVAGGEQGVVVLRVEGVGMVADYADLMSYLQSLEYLTRVEVLEAGADYLRLAVETAADVDRLQELLGAGERLVPAGQTGLDPVVRLDPTLIWQG